MRGSRFAWLFVPGVLFACGSEDAPADDVAADAADAAAPMAGMETVTIVARDYAFEAPASIEGGVREIRIVNQGTELHHIQFVRLDPGSTMDDLMAAYGAGDFYPSFAHDVGGPNLAPPGGESTAKVHMTAGTYAVLCVIPSPDMTMHVEKGMMTVMEVTEPSHAMPAPEPDLQLTLRDYGFEFSGEITAGTHTIRVSTEAAQSHELVIFGLPEGGSAEGILQWIENGQQGPPPFRPVGGVTALAQGETNDVTIDFAPGRYAFICFLPDAGDGAPHFVHGMVQEYTVS